MSFSASVVIVTHKRPDLLARMLKTLDGIEVPPELLEVVVIENGSADCGSREVCEATDLPFEINWHYFTDRALAKSRNHGVNTARGDFVIVFDDDIRFDRSTLAAFCGGARKYGPRHFFGGPFETDRESAVPDWLAAHLPISALGWSLGSDEVEMDGPHFIGCGGLGFFRSDFARINGFPEYLGINANYICLGEEVYLQRFFLADGCRGIYLPEARIWHFVPPQRCDFKFAVSRSNLFGVTRTIAGLVLKDPETPSEAPRWMYRKWLTQFLKLKYARMRGVDEKGRIKQECDFAELSGILRGYSLYKKFAPKPNPPNTAPPKRDARAATRTPAAVSH